MLGYYNLVYMLIPYSADAGASSVDDLSTSLTRPGRMKGLVVVLLLSTATCAAGTAQWELLWTSSVEDGPPDREAHGMAIVGDTMVVQGGLGYGSAYLSDLWLYDLRVNDWTLVGHSNELHRAGHTFFAVAEIVNTGREVALYTWGGTDGSETSVGTGVLHRLQLTNHSVVSSTSGWKAVDTGGSSGSPGARWYHTGQLYLDPTTADRKMVVYGGRTVEGLDLAYADTWSLDLVTYTWTLHDGGSKANTPYARFNHASTVMDGKLIIFGGLTFLGQTVYALDDMWIYDLKSGLWREQKMQVALTRSTLPMLAVPSPNEWAVAFGGCVYYPDPGVAFVFNDALFWDGHSKYWKKLVAPSTAAPGVRYNHRGALWHNDTLVYYGGSFHSVIDGGEVWALNVSQVTSKQLVRADSQATMLIYYSRLFFVLISLMVLSIFACCFYVRTRFQHRGRRTSSMVTVDSSMLPAGPVSAAARAALAAEEAIKLLPIVPYKSKTPEGPDATPTTDRDLCAICLIDYEEEEPLRQLPCGHIFHVDCVDQWLHQSLICPLCKRDARQQLPPDGAGTTEAAQTRGTPSHAAVNRLWRLWRRDLRAPHLTMSPVHMSPTQVSLMNYINQRRAAVRARGQRGRTRSVSISTVCPTVDEPAAVELSGVGSSTDARVTRPTRVRSTTVADVGDIEDSGEA